MKNIDNTKYFGNFDLKGSSNYAFPLILNTKKLKVRDEFEKYLIKHNIEFRRGNAGGGNQLRQPYLKKLFPEKFYLNFPNTEHVHFYGFYMGNYPTLQTEDIDRLCKIINKV